MCAAHDFELPPHADVPADAAEHGRAALADPDPGLPLEDLLAKYADDLAAYPDER